jgi:diguanylate cyclase (GGDEF)-like protein
MPRIWIGAGALALLAMLTGATVVFALDRPQAAPLIPWAMILLLGLGIVLGSSTRLVRQHHQWLDPLRQLEKALRRARAAEASIEELSQITGPLSPLTGAIQELLRELRQEKARYAELEQELRQRVAQRTDALERMIGGLRQQATRDPLTGLYNRRFLDQELRSLVGQAFQQGRNVCLLMLDLDNFKNLNDSLGHGAGDELLRSVGQIIRSTVREGDMAFRYGGDEFVILLPDHGSVAGEGLGRRLVSLVGELGRTLKTPRPVGLSAGWATLGELPEPRPEALLAEADKRLYQTKSDRKRAA